MEGAGDVGCAVEVLASGVDQVDHVFGYFRAVLFCCVIMDDCSIGPTPTNSIKTQPHIPLLSPPQPIHPLRRLIFPNFLQARPPRPKLNHSNAINQMTSPKPINFFLSSHSTVETYPIPWYWLFYFTVN